MKIEASELMAQSKDQSEDNKYNVNSDNNSAGKGGVVTNVSVGKHQ